MNRRLPPLDSLRAFEAAARYLSFTKAADELNVTQAAISHRIRGLEDRLGVSLFRRRNRGLLLTDDGQTLFAAANEALEGLDAAIKRLGQRDRGGTLTVSALPSFAAKWLVPRLGRFREARPEIDVLVNPSGRQVALAREDVDVAIRYGRGPYPGLRADRLLSEEIVPVCSPRLATPARPLREPADLRHHTLLHDEGHTGWRLWLAANGIDGVETTRGPVFDDSGMLIEAAAGGQGVALGRSALVAEDLARGRLVLPFDIRFASELSYFVISLEATAEREKIRAFREWLLAEAGSERGEGDAPAVLSGFFQDHNASRSR